MRRSIGILCATLALSVTSAVAAIAQPDSPAADGKEMVTCPIAGIKVEKSKAIAVKTKSGRTVYVCCPGCVAAAKQLN